MYFNRAMSTENNRGTIFFHTLVGKRENEGKFKLLQVN